MSDTVSVDLCGTVKLIKMLDDVGKSPQKAVNKAASKAITPVLRAVRNEAPVATGCLKAAITRKGERSRLRGKKVYEVTFSSKYNDVLQKPIQNPGLFGGKSDHAYYPASQEYGFLTRSRGGGYSYIPGLHFMREGAEKAAPAARQIMISTMEKELDKLWQEARHG